MSTWQLKINQIFDLLEHAWRFIDGEFFKLDTDFIGARVVGDAHSALTKFKFNGAVQEFARARRDAASGEPKDAILNAAKSFESVLKVLTGLEHANADMLIKALTSQGYLDDLSDEVRIGFRDQVLKALPFMRNKLAGHGQGAAIVQVPLVYADLALQLSAAFHNFLIAKHLQRQPQSSSSSTNPSSTTDTEIPF